MSARRVRCWLAWAYCGVLGAAVGLVTTVRGLWGVRLIWVVIVGGYNAVTIGRVPIAVGPTEPASGGPYAARRGMRSTVVDFNYILESIPLDLCSSHSSYLLSLLSYTKRTKSTADFTGRNLLLPPLD
jgi:hypothetical protein